MSIKTEEAFSEIISYRRTETNDGIAISYKIKSLIIIVIISIVVIITLICTILSTFISRIISNALIETTNYAKIIESGDLSSDDLEISTNDELSIMTKTFNNMKNSLRNIVKKIIETSHCIRTNVKLLNEKIVQNFYAIEQIHKAVENIAASSEEQTIEMNNLLRNLGRLYNNTNSIMENLKQNSMNENEKKEIFNKIITFRENLLNIKNSSKTIFDLSEGFTANSEEISASLQEQVIKLKQMVTGSNGLLGYSENLDKSMKTFILPEDYS